VIKLVLAVLFIRIILAGVSRQSPAVFFRTGLEGGLERITAAPAGHGS
jgi:hypothetical protein